MDQYVLRAGACKCGKFKEAAVLVKEVGWFQGKLVCDWNSISTKLVYHQNLS